MVNPPSFPWFPDLPLEVRLSIWKAALPGPRIVYLQRRPLISLHCSRVWSDRATNSPGLSFFEQESASTTTAPESYAQKRFGYHSACTISLLYVCRESYEVASKVYSRAFGSVSAFPQTWFNFDLDTLYLDYKLFGGPVRSDVELGDDFRKVMHLAVFGIRNCVQTGIPNGLEPWLHEIWKAFGNIRTFQMVLSIFHPEHWSVASLALMDPLDLHGALIYGEEPYSPDREALFLFKQGRYVRDIMNYHRVSVAHLEATRHRDLGKNKLPFYSLPRIDYKIITTTRCKAAAERQRLARNYPPREDPLEGQSLNLILQFPPGIPTPLSLNVKKSDPVYKVELIIRSSRIFPSGHRLLLFFDGEELGFTSLIAEYDLEEFDIIDVHMKQSKSDSMPDYISRPTP